MPQLGERHSAPPHPRLVRYGPPSTPASNRPALGLRAGSGEIPRRAILRGPAPWGRHHARRQACFPQDKMPPCPQLSNDGRSSEGPRIRRSCPPAHRSARPPPSPLARSSATMPVALNVEPVPNKVRPHRQERSCANRGSSESARLLARGTTGWSIAAATEHAFGFRGHVGQRWSPPGPLSNCSARAPAVLRPSASVRTCLQYCRLKASRCAMPHAPFGCAWRCPPRSIPGGEGAAAHAPSRR